MDLYYRTESIIKTHNISLVTGEKKKKTFILYLNVTTSTWPTWVLALTHLSEAVGGESHPAWWVGCC